MEYIYKITKSEMSDELGVPHILYGLICIDTSKGEEIRKIDGIFTDRKVCSSFLALANRLGLSPLQLDDVLEDILAEM